MENNKRVAFEKPIVDIVTFEARDILTTSEPFFGEDDSLINGKITKNSLIWGEQE